MAGTLQVNLQHADAYEFMSTRIFWIMGALITLNGYWINHQIVQFDRLEKKAEMKDAGEKSGSSEKHPGVARLGADPPLFGTATTDNKDGLFWLQPHITSDLRKRLAVLMCSLMLPVQVLHGYWVVRTAMRISVATHKATYLYAQPFVVRYALYTPVLGTGIAVWVLLLAAGTFFVSGQLTYVLKLMRVDPNAPLHMESSAKKKG